MKINKNLVRWGIPALGVATAITLVAWKESPRQTPHLPQLIQDTLPNQKKKASRDKEEKDFDKEIRQLEEAKSSMKNVDWEHVNKAMDEVRKNFDAQKIQQHIELAMKQVDFEKIEKEIEASLKQVDFEKIEKEINESVKTALSEADKKSIRKELAEAKLEVDRELKNKDWKKELENAKIEIEEAKKIDMKEVQEELKAAQSAFDQEMKNLDKEKFDLKVDLKDAWKEIDKATLEIKGYQEMVYSLEKEGLLSTKGDYTIKYKEGTLTVNGNQQPKAVADRYKKYFSHEKVTIRKEDGKMDVDVD